MANSSIKEYYAGKSVFLTGATGFVGKALIEKLLRSCPKIEKIYIMIRAKNGKSPEERLKDITDLSIFDKLKEMYPDAIKDKLQPISGESTELGLGLSEEDRKLLIENVSIIFNGAASVKFDDPLKKAILMNVRGTREVIKLALEMKKLEVFLHISTTYCHTDREIVEEELYPPHGDWRKSIKVAESIDEHTLQTFSLKYIKPLTNTYTFTKSLAEHVVYDMCKDKLPAVVFRPSIVISTRNDPVPGWVGNFNGPVGLLVASGKGILRSSYANPNARADYMPVDLVVRALVMAAWQKGILIDTKKKLDIEVYNCSSNTMHSLNLKELIDFGKQLFWEAPLSNILWFPGGSVTGCKYWNYIRVVFLHLLPALVIDGILKLAKRKPILVNIQRRIYIANMALHYFITNQWKFINSKTLTLERNLIPEETKDFEYDVDGFNVYEYFRNCLLHGRRYLLKEDDSNIERAKVNLYRMYILDRVVKLLIYIFLYWFLVYKLNIFTRINYKFHSIYNGIMGY